MHNFRDSSSVFDRRLPHFTLNPASRTYAAKIRKMQNSAVQKAAKDILRPDKLVWVVVGDRSQIEAPLKSLGFKTIRFVDADGKIVE